MDWPLGGLESDAAVAVVQGMADLFSRALLVQCFLLLALALIFFRNPAFVSRFWCSLSGRYVEVVFDQRSLAILPAACTVRSCSAFDPPTAVTCDQRCVSKNCRLPAPPPRLELGR